MRISPASGALVISGFVLSACAPTVPQYETISSTAATTSPLAGTAFRLTIVDGNIAAAELTDIGGSVTHNTGRIAISDGIYLLVDPDGFDINGEVTDGAVTGRRLDGDGTGLIASTYDYVIPFGFEYIAIDGELSIGGTAGIATRTADVPSAGSAQYTGEAFTFYSTADGLTLFILKNGISIVDVDFAAGKVDATVGLFTNINGVDGPPTAAPIDAVSGTGMTIVGASFSGGTWATYKDGELVNVTGAGTSIEGGGNFYGYDSAISGPDEVAGVFLIDGSTATVFGIFVAD